MSNRRCIHCGRAESQHAAGGKCVFEPTTFEGKPPTDRQLYGTKKHILRRFTNETYCLLSEYTLSWDEYVQREIDLNTSDVCRICMKQAEHDLHTTMRKK